VRVISGDIGRCAAVLVANFTLHSATISRSDPCPPPVQYTSLHSTPARFQAGVSHSCVEPTDGKVMRVSAAVIVLCTQMIPARLLSLWSVSLRCIDRDQWRCSFLAGEIFSHLSSTAVTKNSCERIFVGVFSRVFRTFLSFISSPFRFPSFLVSKWPLKSS